MNSKNKKILLCVAVLFIGAGILAIAYLALDAFLFTKDDSTAETYMHDDIEYKYDEIGRLSSEIYYEKDVYAGQTDYFYDGMSTHKMVYNADNELIENSVVTVNAFMKPLNEETYINGELASSYECSYYDDQTTPKIETVIEYENGDEIAVKTYFYENGDVRMIREYLNGELTNETDYAAETAVAESESETNEG